MYLCASVCVYVHKQNENQTAEKFQLLFFFFSKLRFSFFLWDSKVEGDNLSTTGYNPKPPLKPLGGLTCQRETAVQENEAKNDRVEQ